MAAGVIPDGLSPRVFRERYSDWTGRAWLDVDGDLPARLDIQTGYQELRRTLKARFPDHPWQSDWQDGVFPIAPFGAPMWPALLSIAALWVGLIVAAFGAFGWPASVAVLLFGLWPVARCLDGVEVSREGLRVGPIWADRVPWHQVTRVGARRVGREMRVWALHGRGASSGSIPEVLLPALRSLVRRCGALPLEEGDGGLDVRYASWQPAAAGIPWGVLAGTAASVPMLSEPFLALLAGGTVALGLSLLGAAVHARATGWGAGAIGWLVLLEALIFSLLSLGVW